MISFNIHIRVLTWGQYLIRKKQMLQIGLILKKHAVVSPNTVHDREHGEVYASHGEEAE